MIAAVDLREAVRRQPLDLPSARTLLTAELLAARDHWRIHMAAEFASSRVFAGLVAQLMAAGLPFEYVRDATEMAREEVEHGLQSARVFAALGGEPVSALPALTPVPQHDDVGPLEAVLRNVISVSCCGETLAVSVIGGERDRTTEPPLRAILTRILSDEIGHARFGWRLLGEVASAMDADMRRRLSAYLVVIFERDVKILHDCLETPSATAPSLALGAADGPLAWSTFIDTMRDATLPSLQRHGLQAHWAFERACERAGVGLAA